jgi:predicted membrane protein
MKHWVKELIGTIVILILTVGIHGVAGRDGLFWIMWLFFLVVAGMSIAQRKERFFGFMWLLFTISMAVLYFISGAWILS